MRAAATAAASLTPGLDERQPWLRPVLLPRAWPAFVAPEGLALRKVALVIRHGLRTPVHNMFVGDTTPWECGRLNNLRVSLHTQAEFPDALPVHSLYRVHNLSPPDAERRARDLAGNCHPGELTTMGFQQHQLLGAYLRQRYGPDGAQLWPTQLASAQDVFVRSTNYERTIESAQALLEGVFPDRSLMPRGESIVINVRHHSAENMFWRETCARVLQLTRQYDASPEAVVLRTRLGAMGAVSANGRPLERFHDMASTVDSMIVHGHAIPSGLDAKAIHRSTLEEIELWAGTTEMSRLATGDFFREVVIAWTARPQTLQLYSGHDHTILPLLGMMGITLEHPPMGSCLAFEVFENVDNPHDLYCRVLYNGETLRVPLCAPRRPGEAVYSLDEFKRAVIDVVGDRADICKEK